MHFIHRMYMPQKQNSKLKKNQSQRAFEITVVYEWVQNELIYANPQTSLENRPNLMKMYDNFFVCLNGI